MITGSLLSI